MTTITLKEYFPWEEEYEYIFKPQTYIELLPKDLSLYLVKYFLNDVDKICLDLSNKKEGRYISQQELDTVLEESEQYDMDLEYWNEYDPFDRWEYEYGEQDFSVVWSDTDKYK